MASLEHNRNFEETTGKQFPQQMEPHGPYHGHTAQNMVDKLYSKRWSSLPPHYENTAEKMVGQGGFTAVVISSNTS
uniref:Uncharacterized protein n=1 Tax=Timema douglasi TaxID=61478 RepID=A0A7R8ZGL6_TIMDO|nr:unnamed protein product [Timema douglasi]